MFFNIFHKSKPIQKLPFVTDIHCHVIPGVDDGSPNLETSIDLLSHMADWGLTRIFASPHSTQDTFENTPETIAQPSSELRAAIQQQNLPIEMNVHMEYRLDRFFMKQFEDGNLIALPGNYLLVENAFNTETWGFESLLHRIRSTGYTPILAHPERYRYYSGSHKYRYAELHDYGLYFQVNLLSLAGHYGSLERDMALYMLERGLVQFVGTDLHRASHVVSIENYLKSSKFLKDIKYLEKIQNDTL